MLETLGLAMRDLFTPSDGCATAQPAQESEAGAGSSTVANAGTAADPVAQPIPPDLTLVQYARAKGISTEFLARLGLRDVPYQGGHAVRIPYLDEGGEEAAVRFRLRLERLAGGDGRFKWRSGTKVMPYGLWRLANAQATAAIVLVEGESDAQTLWSKGIPALGVPGASNWKPEWATYLEGIPAVFAVRETDKAGSDFIQSLLRTPALRDRLRVVDLPTKDVSELYLRDSDDFERAFAEALDRSSVAVEEERAAAEAERTERATSAWELCETLAREHRILDKVVEALRRRGLVGSLRLARLVYLATTSRLLKRPVSVVVKGPSSAGKSYETEVTLELFPPSVYYVLTAMSEHALAYSEEPLAHRMMVIYEAAGLESDFASYLLRSLLSEGRIRYETVEKTKDGMRARLIERPGPTGTILTTTHLALHPENETRLLSIPVDDSQEQTRRVMDALAEADETDEAREGTSDEWYALQDWLEKGGERRVAVPFACTLAREIPPVAVRLRRDFGLLLTLIRTHALLHQATRERDANGRIIATIADDYATVHDLAAALLSEAASATVSPIIRETVEAVAVVIQGGKPEARNDEIAVALKRDKGATSRRVRAAVSAGYLRNLEERRGRPVRIVLGDPLPEERPLLPEPADLARLHGCDRLQAEAQPPSQREYVENGPRLHSCIGHGGARGSLTLPPDGPFRDEFEERAGLLEFEAGLAREQAERQAAEELGLLRGTARDAGGRPS